jgi:hypothetical protein
MIRAAFRFAVVALIAWFAIRVVFGFAGGVMGLLLALAWLALKVLLVVGIVYWVISVFSPETAAKVRSSWKRETL